MEENLKYTEDPIPLAPIRPNSAWRSARPEARNENGMAQRAARKETGSSVPARTRTRSTYESQAKKRKQKGRGGEVRTSWRMSGRRGGRRRRPVAGSRGAPHRRCSGAGVGWGEARRGVGGGARVRGFLSFCIVAEGWDGREEGERAARLDCTIINGAEEGLKT